MRVTFLAQNESYVPPDMTCKRMQELRVTESVYGGNYGFSTTAHP